MTVAKYLPAKVDIEYQQGDTVTLSFIIRGKNLEGGTGTAQVRRNKDSTSTLLATFAVTLEDDGDDTNVTALLASGSNTAVGRGWWDLEIVDGGVTRTYLAGRATIHPEITP